MPLIREQKELYAYAMAEGFIIPAFNFYDLESLRALLEAAREEDSPIILEISRWAYANLQPLDPFLAFVETAAREYPVPVMLHHDYLPTLEDCRQAVDRGFLSISIDGSRLPFEENICLTRRAAEYAHERGAFVEAELGNVPGAGFSSESIYTDPGQAAEFIERTGCDALAVSVGTTHGGLRREQPLEIQHRLLGEIRQAVGETPLALHGAASRLREYSDKVNRFGGSVEPLTMASEEEVSRTAQGGVVKIYADMDNWLAVTGGLREYFSRHPQEFQPARYLPCGGRAMKEAARRKIQRVTGGAGRGQAFMRLLEERKNEA